MIYVDITLENRSIIYLFFLKHAGELRIDILRRKGCKAVFSLRKSLGFATVAHFVVI